MLTTISRSTAAGGGRRYDVCLALPRTPSGSGVAGGAALKTPAELFGIGVKGWNDCWLDFYDMISEGVLMPLGAMVMSLLIGWKWGTDMIMEECEAGGKKAWGRNFFNICFKFITPLGMVVVLYGQLASFFGC